MLFTIERAFFQDNKFGELFDRKHMFIQVFIISGDSHISSYSGGV